MRKTALLSLVCIALMLAFPGTTWSQASQLKVIPEVQTFVGSSGTLSLPANLRILVQASRTDSLMPVAEQLRDDLHIMRGFTATIATTTATQAGAGEILLQFNSSAMNNPEAYKMTIADGISISGASKIGTFWATRTVLQLVDNYRNVIPRGFINDYPSYPSRGFMLDVGRKFFTIEFLQHYVKMMSYYKLNEFQVHLNDNGFKSYFDNDFMKTYSAFRLQSDSFPGLAAKDGHYTKEEFRDLQKLGMRYGVNVIPEIDVPAHSLAFTQYKPELAMNSEYMDHLSIHPKDTAHVYAFIDKLLAEYTTGENPVFIGPDLHIGTDEYDRKYAVEFYHFTDRYIKYVEHLGYRARLWGGMRWMQPSLDAAGLTSRITNNKGAIINAWSRDWVDANQQLRDGFKIINTCDAWLYIVPGAGYYRDTLDTYDLYRNFKVERVNPSETIAPELRSGLIGAMFAVWNDIVGNGISQQDVHHRALPAFKVLSTKFWKTNPSRSYAAYRAVADSVAEGPGLNFGGKYNHQEMAAISDKLGATARSFNGTTRYELGGSDFGYDYDISFDLKPSAGNNANAILFQSYFSKVTLNTGGSGKLGFSRDGYTFTFNYLPTTGTWQTIRLTGDWRGVTLYVDGQRIERLTVQHNGKFNVHRTLFFPLEAAGDATNGFKGEIKNLQLAKFDSSEQQKEFMTTQVTLPEGEYYIRANGQYLTNTNGATPGGNPVFRAMYTTEPALADQRWKISIDPQSGRHKLTAASHPSKYVNEICNFGTNPYSHLWNTYLFYKKDNKYALQNAQNGGRGFWIVNNNRLSPGEENYDESSYVLELIPANATALEAIPGATVGIITNGDSLSVTGIEPVSLQLYSSNGCLEAQISNSNTLKTKALEPGVYIVRIESKEGKGSYKVVL